MHNPREAGVSAFHVHNMRRQDRRGLWRVFVCPIHSVDLNHGFPVLSPATPMYQQTQVIIPEALQSIALLFPFSHNVLLPSWAMEILPWFPWPPVADMNAVYYQAPFVLSWLPLFGHLALPALDCSSTIMQTLRVRDHAWTFFSLQYLTQLLAHADIMRMSRWLSAHEHEGRNSPDNFGIAISRWLVQWWCHQQYQETDEFCLRLVECEPIIEPTNRN